MAHHYSVGTHCGQRIERVYKRLAFRHARCTGRNGDDVGAKPFRSDLEAGPRPGGGFEKQIYDCSAAQGIKAFEALPSGRLKISRACQDSFDFRAREGLDIKQTPPHVPLFHFLRGRIIHSLHQQDLLLAIDLLKFHLNDFICTGLNHSAYVTRLDR